MLFLLDSISSDVDETSKMSSVTCDGDKEHWGFKRLEFEHDTSLF